jgi:hypothetical protein
MVEGDRLEKGLTEINPNDASIDTFTEFATPQAIRFQMFSRQLGNEFKMRHFEEKADYNSELMRSYRRAARKELTLSNYKDIQMFREFVGLPYSSEANIQGDENARRRKQD